MPRCDICDSTTKASDHYDCTYCGGSYCGTHRVPESHDCVFAAALEPPWESKLGEDRKYDSTVNRQARGDASARPNSHRSKASQSAVATGKQPESYPAKRRTEAMPEPEQSPGGKQHRDWTPESKSPDVAPDGSIAGGETARLRGGGERALTAVRRRLRLWARAPLRTLLRLAVLGIVFYAVYFVLGSV